MKQPTSEARPEDVEIYIAASAELISAWLVERFGADIKLKVARRGGMLVHQGELAWGGATIPVLIVDDVADSFASLLFAAVQAPWQSDLACAQDAAAALRCEVRCVDRAWRSDQSEDEGWLAITADNVRAIRWQPA